MSNQDITTLTGLSIEQAIEELDRELPPEAYKKVPGGVDLTDIDPNHMRRVLNEVFGLCGYGWGYNYSPEHAYTRTDTRPYSGGGERTVVVAVVKHLEFWYRLLVDGEIVTCTIPATGASENKSDAYALKGALTSAIGNAASNIGFQLSVYLGKRSHKTVGKAPRKAASKAPVKTAPKPAPADDIEDLDDTPATESTADLGDYEIPIGKNKGKKLSAVTSKAVEWYANEMSPTTPKGRELQAAAKAYLKHLQVEDA